MFNPGRSSVGQRVTRDEVAGIIRRDILSGAFAPGLQIPTREVLSNQLGASYVTVQRGLDRLRNEGFITSRRGCGTFVVKHPPHLYHYALVLPPTPPPGSLDHSQFHALLEAEANLIERELPPRRVTTWHQVEFHEDNEPFQALHELVRHRCLAGLIFPGGLGAYLGSSLLDTPHVPVAMIGKGERKLPPVACLLPDLGDFLAKACRELALQGRRRVAIIYPPRVFKHQVDDAGTIDFLIARAAEAGLASRPWWNLPIQSHNALGVRHFTRLLLDHAEEDRPDGLILVDDHQVLPATQAVADSGLHAPRDLGVVAYCNFPRPPQTAVPVRRLGFDIRHLLRECLTAIDRARPAGPADSLQRIPALFEEELPYPIA